MALVENLPEILAYIQNLENELEENHDLFRIFQGDLLSFIEQDLKNELNDKVYERVRTRIAPLNVLRRIVQKLSKVYAQPPKRTTENDTDQELMDFYVKSARLDSYFNDANEFFNLFKNTAIESFVFNGKPAVRVIPSHRFSVWTSDVVNPQEPEVFIKFLGPRKLSDVTQEDRRRTERKILNRYHLFTDTEFLAIDSEGGLVAEDMLDNPEGINPFGKIPFVYMNRSRHQLWPTRDSDTLVMAKLVPKLFTDLNYATLFQSFSIFFGIDVDPRGLDMAPNGFWDLKTDSNNPNASPQVGTLKPTVDIAQTLELIKTLMATWMETRGIRPGSAGVLNSDNAVSGVNLMIQNMDATEDKKVQIVHFEDMEKEYWDLVAKQQDIWAASGMIEDKRTFSNEFEPTIEFSEPKPVQNDNEKVQKAKELLNLKLTTKKRAAMEIFGLDDTEAEKLLEEVKEESEENMKRFQNALPSPLNQNQKEDNEEEDEDESDQTSEEGNE